MSLISSQLAAILVCPVDHGDLEQDETNSVLKCRVCDRIYPVEDGIPVMIAPEDRESDR